MKDKRSSLHLTLTASYRHSLVALALTLLAFALRLHRMDFQPLWGDEGWSFYFASMPLGEMIRLTAEDIHPPLYYALLGGWLRLVDSTAEVARFLSILVGTLLVPLVYRVAGRLFNATAGLTTAAVVSLAPFAIYYSQEVRMYGLVTLLGLGSIYFFIHHMSSSDKQSIFWGYILTTAGALYTMYYAVFIPILQFIFFLLARRRSLRQLVSHPFTRALSVVALLYLPWVIYATQKLITYVGGKRSAEGYVSLDFARFIASHLVAFSLGHLSAATQVMAGATLLFVGIALLGLIYRTPRHAQLLLLYLFIPLLLGYGINLFYPFTPRYFERTLMLAAPAWWLLLGGGLAWLWRRSRWGLVGASVVLLLPQMVMLLEFYNTPRYEEEDYRHLLSYVQAHATPDDVFLASYQWQTGFYYAYLSPPRPALFVVPEWGKVWAADPDRMRADLDALLENHRRLWFPAYQSLGRLWETSAESYLNRSAFPVTVDWSIPSTKLTLYAQGRQLTPLATSTNFNNQLQLTQASIKETPVEAGGGIMPISLTWRKLGHLGSDHRVALRLTDSNGHTWASRDSLPQGGEASFTELEIGEQLVDHHGLAIPAGTPPGDYQLRLSVRDQANDHPLDLLDDQGQPQGVEVVLTTAQVVPPAEPLPAEALPVQHALKADFDGGVRLLGYSLGEGPFKAGDSLSFSLFWQALDDVDESYIVFAQLQDTEGKPVALSESPPIYASNHWTSGTLLRDLRQIPLPPTLPADTYRLVVGLLRSDGSRLPVEGDHQIVLTSLETRQRQHEFSPPAPSHTLDAEFGQKARLIGYDLRGETNLRPGDSLTLILYWQALEPLHRSYTVFAHVVDSDDRIFGQRDQIPGGGDFPTTSWVPGEYLTDAYAIPIKPDTPGGDYWIEVGLYHPLDGTRLPVTDSSGQLIGNRLLLKEANIRVAGNE